MPPMSAAQEASWLALFELHEQLPGGWTLIGGQLVHLHCAERGSSSPRPTVDADTVLDVQNVPTILLSFTRVLLNLGFVSAGVSAEDKEHRFVRDQASIDVLIPQGVGERLPRRKGVTGSETVQVPGGIQALRRSSVVEVDIAGAHGFVRRPDLVGALIVKAAAHTVPGDPYKGRHRSDFATLAALLSRADFTGEAWTASERRYLRMMVAAVVADDAAVDGRPDVTDGLTRIGLVLQPR